MPSKRSKPAESGERSALRLLGIRDHSREEMRQKLNRKGLGTGEVEEVITKLEARGLIDDRRYARRLAAFYFREKLWGAQRVIERLLQKGISLELAKEVTDQAEEDGSSRERLGKVLKLKLKGQGLGEMLPRERRRLANYLRQRGFPWEDIMEALQEAGGSAEE